MRKRGLIPLLLVAAIGSTAVFAPLFRNNSANDIAESPSVPDRDVAVIVKRMLRDEEASSLFRGWRTREAVREFYASRGFAPLWIENGGPSSRYTLTREYLETVGKEGMQASDYVLPAMKGAAAILAQHELMATRTVLRYAQDANGGRVDFRKIAREIAYGVKTLDAATFLRRIAEEGKVVAALQSLHPAHPRYVALRYALAELSAAGQPTDIVVANMERWRWLPHDFEPTRIVVNVPDYSLRLHEKGEPAFLARIVAGSPATPTPLLVSSMTSITFNPVWNVPASIVRSPAMQPFVADETLRRQARMSLVTDANGRPLLSQAPGPQNPLGRVRFNLPNAFAVYLHDTPDSAPFERPIRALSHGCVRMENARSLAETILATDIGESAGQRVRELLGEEDADHALAAPLPVYFTYETVVLDQDGAWQQMPDVYRYDARVLEQLNNREIPPDRIALTREPERKPTLSERIYRRVQKFGDATRSERPPVRIISEVR